MIDNSLPHDLDFNPNNQNYKLSIEMETDCCQFTKMVLLLKELRWDKTECQFHLHYVLYVDAKEDIWIADCENNKVEKFDSKGHFLSKSRNEAAKHISEFGKSDNLLKNRKMDSHVHKNQISKYNS